MEYQIIVSSHQESGYSSQKNTNVRFSNKAQPTFSRLTQNASISIISFFSTVDLPYLNIKVEGAGTNLFW